MEGPIFELLRDRWVDWQRRQRTSRGNQVREARSICAALVAACAMHAGAAVAANTSTDDALQRGHAWARFGVGAWRQVRILTETFDEQGQVTSSSVADNLTTLEKVGADGVTLKMEVTVEVAGQKFPSPPQFVQEGYAGETLGQTVSITPLGDEKLTVDGREIACRSQQIEILGGGNKEVVQISYLPDSTPTILRRKSTTRDARGETMQEAISEVFALDKRLRVLGEAIERRGYRMRQVLKTARGTTTAWSDHVDNVPGEVVAHTSQKLDSEGRLVRRTTLELVDFGTENRDPDASELSRRQRRQQRRGR